jgi:hypothetical protein
MAPKDAAADQPTVEMPPDAQPTQVKPTADMSDKEVKESLAHQPDKDLHPSKLEREADKSSAPGALDAEAHDPPVRTAAPDKGIRSLAIGAGAHEPPNADHFDQQGRAVLSGLDSDGNPEYAVSS